MIFGNILVPTSSAFLFTILTVEVNILLGDLLYLFDKGNLTQRLQGGWKLAAAYLAAKKEKSGI